MRGNRRKLIVGMLVATMALTGVLVGTVSADTEDNGNPRANLMARVAQILGIDQQDLEDSFAEARQEIVGEARDSRCQAMIDAGIITQEQADDCTAWMESRPDNRGEMQEWFESRPDMGDECYGFGGPRMGMGGSRMGMGGSGGCGLAGQMGGGGLGDCTGPYDECPLAQ